MGEIAGPSVGALKCGGKYFSGGKEYLWGPSIFVVSASDSLGDATDHSE